MKKLFVVALSIFVAIFFTACTEKPAPPAPESFNVSVYLPSSISIEDGATYTLTVISKDNAKDGDIVKLAPMSGASVSVPVQNIRDKSFDITFPKGFIQGKYTFFLTRGDKEIQLGVSQVNVTYNGAEIELTPGTTVYGWVKCDGAPIKDAVISDGFEVVTTDEDGLYQMASEKRNPYVFISIPSGYTVAAEGILPSFSVYLSHPADKPERADFQLIREDGQDNHTMLFFGDIHLANRNRDREQFSYFVDDVNNYVSTVSGPVYAMTLGDMTWDQYWYSNSYEFKQYLIDANRLKGLKVFHTIGNHDHDMNAVGDWDTVVKYKKEICPPYYSFNVGKVHYIAIDNILCGNKKASTTEGSYRDYDERVAPEVIEWLKKDLAHVDKSMRIVATSHAAIYSQNGKASLRNAAEYIACFSGYKVDFVTGHTHKLWNIDKTASNDFFEHNSGAVCAAWWWTGYYTNLNFGQDGTPSGWRIMKFNGAVPEWQYKGTNKPLEYQFRTYDRNAMNITAETYAPNADKSHADSFNKLVKDNGWAGASANNYVYINIWDYDASWTVSVKEAETGKSLEAKKISCSDPLYLIAYSANRYNKNKNPTFAPYNTTHMFRVQASSPTSTLEISVKDRFGRTFSQTMKRPKQFNVNIYLNEK